MNDFKFIAEFDKPVQIAIHEGQAIIAAQDGVYMIIGDELKPVKITDE